MGLFSLSRDALSKSMGSPKEKEQDRLQINDTVWSQGPAAQRLSDRVLVMWGSSEALSVTARLLPPLTEWRTSKHPCKLLLSFQYVPSLKHLLGRGD